MTSYTEGGSVPVHHRQSSGVYFRNAATGRRVDAAGTRGGGGNGSSPNHKRRANTDAVKLLMLGYRPELAREFTLLNNLGASIVALNPLGLAGTYGIGTGYTYGGPVVMMWGWPVVMLFTISMGLSLGEMASAYPTSGALYYWSYRLAHPRLRNLACWMTAWILTLGQAAFSASIFYTIVELTCAAILAQYGIELTSAQRFGVLTGFVVVIGLLNMGSARLTAFMTTVGTLWNTLGCVAFCVTLLLIAPERQSAKYVFTSWEPHSEITGISSPVYTVLVGLLMSQWIFTGYDGSAHLAEETYEAEYTVPYGILLAILAVGGCGYLFLLSLTFVRMDTSLRLDTQAPGSNVVLETLIAISRANGGSVAGAVALYSIPLLSAFFGGYQSIANNSRMMYAFARDKAMPLSRYVRRVHPVTQAPGFAVLNMLVLAFLLAVPMCFNEYVFIVITSGAVLACYSGYLIPVLCKLSTRSRYFLPGPFYLGPVLSYINNLVSASWVVMIMVVATLPPLYPVTAANCNWSGPSLAAAVMVLLLWFYFPKVGAKNWFRGPRANLGQFNDVLPSKLAAKTSQDLPAPQTPERQSTRGSRVADLAGGGEEGADPLSDLQKEPPQVGREPRERTTPSRLAPVSELAGAVAAAAAAAAATVSVRGRRSGGRGGISSSGGGGDSRGSAGSRYGAASTLLGEGRGLRGRSSRGGSGMAVGAAGQLERDGEGVGGGGGSGSPPRCYDPGVASSMSSTAAEEDSDWSDDGGDVLKASNRAPAHGSPVVGPLGAGDTAAAAASRGVLKPNERGPPLPQNPLRPSPPSPLHVPNDGACVSCRTSHTAGARVVVSPATKQQLPQLPQLLRRPSPLSSPQTHHVSPPQTHSDSRPSRPRGCPSFPPPGNPLTAGLAVTDECSVSLAAAAASAGVGAVTTARSGSLAAAGVEAGLVCSPVRVRPEPPRSAGATTRLLPPKRGRHSLSGRPGPAHAALPQFGNRRGGCSGGGGGGGAAAAAAAAATTTASAGARHSRDVGNNCGTSGMCLTSIDGGSDFTDFEATGEETEACCYTNGAADEGASAPSTLLALAHQRVACWHRSGGISAGTVTAAGGACPIATAADVRALFSADRRSGAVAAATAAAASAAVVLAAGGGGGGGGGGRTTATRHAHLSNHRAHKEALHDAEAVPLLAGSSSSKALGSRIPSAGRSGRIEGSPRAFLSPAAAGAGAGAGPGGARTPSCDMAAVLAVRTSIDGPPLSRRQAEARSKSPHYDMASEV